MYNSNVAILRITTDAEFLRKKSKPVTEFNARLHQLLDDMRDTLEDAWGLGLAAVQVGVLYRVCLVRCEKSSPPNGGVDAHGAQTANGVVELINPEIIACSSEKPGEEGCLSVPDAGYHTVIRPHKVTVRAQDRNGKTFTRDFEKISAVCACHEIDHMDGILFTDKSSGFARPKAAKRKQSSPSQGEGVASRKRSASAQAESDDGVGI